MAFLGRRNRVHVAQVSDAFVALLDQVLDPASSARGVVGEDCVRVEEVGGRSTKTIAVPALGWVPSRACRRL